MRKISIALAALVVAAPVMPAWSADLPQTAVLPQAQDCETQGLVPVPLPSLSDPSQINQTCVPAAYLALGAAAIIGLSVFAIAETQNQTFVQVRPQVSP